MNIFRGYTEKQKYFVLVFILGFIFKYNFLLTQLFNVPSITGLIFKNIILILFITVYILPLVRNSRGRKYLFWFYFVFTIYFLLNIWYNRYFGNYLSLSDMLMGRGFRPFKVLLRQLLRIVDFVFIADLILLFYYRFKEKSTISIKKIFARQYINYRILVMCLLIVLLICQIYITNDILGSKQPLTLFEESAASFVNVYGIIPLYLYECYTNYFLDEKEVIKIEPVPPTEEYLTGVEGIQKDYNIIVIQVESLDKRIIDYKYNGREVTPFLNKLKRNSLYFDNFYAQHINGSFDAEFSFLTSLYPINKNYSFKINDLSQFDSLVRRLNDKGYQTMAFHGNDKEFFHRYKAFPELGFANFYSREDFSFTDRVMEMDTSFFGLNDYDFFLQSFAHIKEAEQPFFAFLITVTSHTPFDTYPAAERVAAFQEIDDPLVRDYFNSMSFVDKSLEMFFDKIKNTGLAEKTMFIIYSDHNAGIEKEEYSSHKKFVTDENIKTPENVPLFIVHPELEKDFIDKEGSTTDLAPTLLDILGERKKPEEFFGSSLLNKEISPVLFLHEIPLILLKGQLFARQGEEINKIGYSEKTGNKDVKLTNKNNIMDVIAYIKGILLKRRVDSNS